MLSNNEINYIMSDIEEWNMKYNCNRISIEALNKIEIKKRGKGDKKRSFDSEYDKDKLGPYYDPFNNHIHIWKKDKDIKNFKCEQDPSNMYIQFADYKEGTYCSICHVRNLRQQFKWREEPDKDINPDVYKIENSNVYIPPLKKGEFKEFDTVIINKEIETNQKTIKNWGKIMFKVKYVLNNNKIVYNISSFKSFLLWPWEMTPYQKFKYNNKKYKNSSIFIDTDKKFRDKYVYLT